MRSVALAWVVLAVVGCGAKLSSPPEQGDAASASSRAASSSASSGSTSSSASSRAGTSTTVGVTRASDAGSVTVPPQSLRVAAGGDDTCIVSSLGHVACWGANESGELGVGDFDNRWTPTWLPGLQGVTDLVLGASTACVRKVDGSVWCWGGNETDELGVSTGNCPNVGSECTAVPVLAPAVGAGPLTAGPSYECATLVASGGTSCWGRAPFVGATGYDVLSLGCGDTFVCARFDPASGQDPTRNVICSTSFPGNNAAGQLGTGPSGEWTTGPEPAPAPVVTGVPGGFVELAAGDGFTCGVGAAGALACWGDNTYGALGLGAEGENVTFPAVCPSNASFGEAITSLRAAADARPGRARHRPRRRVLDAGVRHHHERRRVLLGEPLADEPGERPRVLRVRQRLRPDPPARSGRRERHVGRRRQRARMRGDGSRRGLLLGARHARPARPRRGRLLVRRHAPCGRASSGAVVARVGDEIAAPPT